ncbi:MAG: response regulator transcription factor [Bacteroidota bacterium]
MSKIKVLVVEDDPNLGTLLSEYLNAKGFETKLCNNGETGFEAFKNQKFDILLLDVMMPVKDGFTLAAEIRTTDKNVPIIFLTAKSLKEDTLKGFEVGGDDYLTKPFTMEVLLARMNAVLRRSGALDNLEEKVFRIGEYIFDHEHQLLKHFEEERKLTTKENDLLYLLCKNKNTVLERDAALRFIWGDDNYFNGRSMDVYIAKLRKYLKEDESVEIVNVHGRGFKLLLN